MELINNLGKIYYFPSSALCSLFTCAVHHDGMSASILRGACGYFHRAVLSPRGRMIRRFTIISNNVLRKPPSILNVFSVAVFTLENKKFCSSCKDNKNGLRSFQKVKKIVYPQARVPRRYRRWPNVTHVGVLGDSGIKNATVCSALVSPMIAMSFFVSSSLPIKLPLLAQTAPVATNATGTIATTISATTKDTMTIFFIFYPPFW